MLRYFNFKSSFTGICDLKNYILFIQVSKVTLNSKSSLIEHFELVKNLSKLLKLLLKKLAS